MWKVLVLLFILRSASIWVLVEEACLEDNVVTPVVKAAVGIRGLEDHKAATNVSEKPYDSTVLTTLVPSTERITKNNLEDSLPTLISMIPKQITTVTDRTTGHSMDGLATSTLFGIITVVLVAVGLFRAIILVIVQKLSETYSP
ncbi:podoplanin [Rhynchocyon petersi]